MQACMHACMHNHNGVEARYLPIMSCFNHVTKLTNQCHGTAVHPPNGDTKQTKHARNLNKSFWEIDHDHWVDANNWIACPLCTHLT
jgi:hypothetical protein